MNFIDIINYLQSIFSFNERSPLLFTQFYFWAFFAFVLAGLSLVYNRILLRNAFLLFVSLFFYFKTSGLFLLILIFSVIFNFFMGKRIYSAGGILKKKLFLTAAVFVNLFVLCYFKYAYFFTDIYNNLFSTDIQVINYFALWTNSFAGSHFLVDKILLPAGVSFYTFQAISYAIDIYRKRSEPVGNILNFGFYMSFFPRLIAGPITRANEFIPQLERKFFLTKKQFGYALFWILNGLAKKIILSDFLAVNFIDRIFTSPLSYTGFENLIALFAYSLQVYADFSGYTDIAVGVAMLMGFSLPKNFNSPYKATNPGEFWKRWHITLSRWLSDYLYIPMGGNKKATFATYCVLFAIAAIVILLSNNAWVTAIVLLIAALLVIGVALFPNARKSIHANINIMNTMLLGGIWHGASWNFMIWGGLNGLGVVFFKFWKKMGIFKKTSLTAIIFLFFTAMQTIFAQPAFKIGQIWTGIIFAGMLIRMFFSMRNISINWIKTSWSVLLTFVFISFTRLFFRTGSNLDPAEANFEAWETAQSMVARIGGEWNFSLIPAIIAEYRNFFIVFAAGMIIHWIPERRKRWYRYNFAAMPLALQLLAVIFVIFVIYQFITAELQRYIYFQF
jgi:D-alanyl-lipoteichoic acid acyltransferase DltB (MBOAT superfamily)